MLGLANQRKTLNVKAFVSPPSAILQVHELKHWAGLNRKPATFSCPRHRQLALRHRQLATGRVMDGLFGLLCWAGSQAHSGGHYSPSTGNGKLLLSPTRIPALVRSSNATQGYARSLARCKLGQVHWRKLPHVRGRARRLVVLAGSSWSNLAGRPSD